MFSQQSTIYFSWLQNDQSKVVSGCSIWLLQSHIKFYANQLRSMWKQMNQTGFAFEASPQSSPLKDIKK